MRPSPRIFALLVCLALTAPIGRGQTLVSPLVKASAAARAGNGSLSRSVVPAAAQTRISAVLGREQLSYHVTPEEGGFRVENPGQGISAEFRSSGMALRNASGRWGMRLARYGYPGAMHDAKAVSPRAVDNRVEYRRSSLTEWYVNGPLGLEQGFTLSRAPGKPSGRPLTLTLALSGDLTATADSGAQGVTLTSHGAAMLRYGGLTVTDAKGRELSASLQLFRNELLLRVHDAGARYPIMVDPLVQSAVLTASDGASGERFGISGDISQDGNTIVLGAPDAEGTKGAAYVFVKPSSAQWSTTSTFTAKLIASDGVADNLFGSGGGVRISSDGNTIAVADGSESTEAYVFVNPGSGWTAGCTGTPCVLTESAKLASSTSHFLFDPLAISPDGSTVAVSGGEDDIFMFVRPAAGWSSSSPLNEANVIGGAEGLSWPGLSADGNVLAGGAAGATINGKVDQGEVEVFFTTDRWTSVAGSAQLTASDGAVGDGLGSTVAMSDDGNTIVSGALNAGGQGAAYVFVKNTNNWGTGTQAAKLVASDTSEGDLGRSVGMSPDGTTIAAGAFTNNDSAVYIFVEPTSGWASSSSPLHEAVKLSEAGDSSFGVPVAITADSNTFLIGRGFANSQTGEAYVFTGSATAPTASLSTTSLTFGNQPVGTTSSTQTVTLTNTGTADLHVSAVSASASFTTTTNCVNASPIAAGGNCSEDVAFAPGSVGSSAGTLTFTDDSGGTAGTMQTVNLSGTAVQASSSTSIGSASPNPALVGQAVTFSFTTSPPIGDTLTPSGTVTVNASTGESCTGSAPSGFCSITFSTAVTRTVSASYGGDTNFMSSTSPNVSEQVVDFSLSVSPLSEKISPGHLATYTLTATSANGFTGSVSLACGALPPHATCAVSPDSLSLSGSTGTARVTINLENKGTYTLTFTGNDGALVRTATASLTVK